MTLPREASVWLALALAVFAGPLLRASSPAAWLGLAVGLAVAWSLAALPPRTGARLLLAGGGAVLLVAILLPSPGPMARWFAPAGGLFYWNPVLWLGLAGAFTAGGRASAGAGCLAAAGYAVAPPTSGPSAFVEAAAVALLVPSIASILEAARRSAAAWPVAWLGAAGAALAVWNFLFMEQYRRNLIPRDDTVSFAEVAHHNVALFEHAFGAPGTWPASWLFAARHHVSPERYAAVASRPWMLEASDTEVVDLGETPAPLLVPLRKDTDVDLTLQAAGVGTLDILVNGVRAATIPLAPDGGELRVRVARSYWRRGVNEVRFTTSAGGEVALGRLILRRVGGTA